VNKENDALFLPLCHEVNLEQWAIRFSFFESSLSINVKVYMHKILFSSSPRDKSRCEPISIRALTCLSMSFPQNLRFSSRNNRVANKDVE